MSLVPPTPVIDTLILRTTLITPNSKYTIVYFKSRGGQHFHNFFIVVFSLLDILKSNRYILILVDNR